MILSTLFGVGLGAFRGLASPDRLARQQIGDALQAARLFARQEGAPSTVLVSPERQTVRAWGLRRVGDWHFESADGFGWPRPLLHAGATIERAGAIGSCLRLTDDALLTLQDPPSSFDAPHGFGLDVMLAPSADARPMTLWERPGVWSVLLDRDDELQVLLQLSDGDDKTSEIRLPVPGVRLSAERFTRLQIVFDGRALQVAVDGLRRQQQLLFDTPRALARNPRVSQGTGRPPTHFRGLLDELHLSAVVAAEAGELPGAVQLEGSQQLIHLDAHGRLDPLWHTAPVQISFVSGEPLRRSVIELGLLGTVRYSRDELPGAATQQPAGDTAGAGVQGGAGSADPADTRAGPVRRDGGSTDPGDTGAAPVRGAAGGADR